MHSASFSCNARLISDWRVEARIRHCENPALVASGDLGALVPSFSAEATAWGAYARIRNVG